jgi:hypothetical protein
MIDHVEYRLRGSTNRQVAYASRNDGKAVESLWELPRKKSCQPIGGSSKWGNDLWIEGI